MDTNYLPFDEDGIYLVNEHGKIINSVTHVEVIPWTTKNGLKVSTLKVGPLGRRNVVNSRMVFKAHVLNDPCADISGYTIEFRDGDRNHISPDNLFAVPFRNSPGRSNRRYDFTTNAIRNNETGAIYSSVTEACQDTGMSRASVYTWLAKSFDSDEAKFSLISV